MDKQTLARLVEVIMSVQLLMRKDLARRYGRDTDTIDRWHASGKLPPGIYLPGCRCPQWRPCDLLEYERRGKLKSL
jgi:hypothetical protein